MKIREYSDIHLDWYFAGGKDFDVLGEIVCWYPPELPDDKETILILAGDLWTGTRFIEWAGYSWIGIVAQRFQQVLIVLGNHDYWPQGNLSIVKGADKCNAMLQDMCLFNVHVLDQSTYAIDDYLFVGATLWTDMDKGNPLTMMSMSQFMAYDGKIKYDVGGKDGNEYRRFTSELWVALHRKHKKYIANIAELNRDKKLVVITHHLPLAQMGDPMYEGNESNGYYYSDLSDLILDNENIVFWCCGHSHCSNDFMFGKTRMYMNPVGYAGEHREQEELVKHEVIELSSLLSELPCSDRPDAPHGFNRNASHDAHRYVCDCEGWSPE